MRISHLLMIIFMISPSKLNTHEPKKLQTFVQTMVASDCNCRDWLYSEVSTEYRYVIQLIRVLLSSSSVNVINLLCLLLARGTTFIYCTVVLIFNFYFCNSQQRLTVLPYDMCRILGYILQDMIRGRTVRCNSLGWHCHMIHCVGKHMEEFVVQVS